MQVNELAAGRIALKHEMRRTRVRERSVPAGGLPTTHEWVAGHQWILRVMMDDAASDRYSGCFVEAKGTIQRLRARVAAETDIPADLDCV